jgi:hypothetical protein
MTTETNPQTMIDAAKAYVRAFCGYGQEASEAAAPHIAQDVDLVSPPLHVYGHAGVMERISGHWPQMGTYKQATWSEPAIDGKAVKVQATFPEGLPTKFLTIDVTFNDSGLIQHVQVAQVRGAAPPAGPVNLTQEIKDLVNNSLANDAPMVLGYMAKDGQPSVSLRGSMVAVSDTQLAFWSRNPEGGVTKAPEYNAKMTVLYRDTPNRVNLLFQGEGRVETDEAVRNKVFEMMPQIEKDHDEPRRGACIVIDLKSVSGATLSGPVRMAN